MLHVAGYFFFAVWATGALIASMYFDFDQRRQCIENEGWLKGWLWCSTETKVSFFGNMLRGLVWPIDVYQWVNINPASSGSDAFVPTASASPTFESMSDFDANANMIIVMQRIRRLCDAGISQARSIVSAQPDTNPMIIIERIIASARDQSDYKQLVTDMQALVDRGLSESSLVVSTGETDKAALRSCLKPAIAALKPEALTPEGQCKAEAIPYFKFAMVREDVPYRTAIRTIEELFAKMRAKGVQGDVEGAKKIMIEVYRRKNETPDQIRDSVFRACMQKKAINK